MIYLLLALTALISYLGASWMVKTAAVRGLLDTPNHRSSHTVPTPRGGGAAIAVAFLLTILVFWLSGFMTTSLWMSILVPAVLVAGIGYIDDHGHISAKIRLVIHLIAMLVVIFGIGLPINDEAGILLSVVLAVFISVGGAWLINLFNFMDGIDGIASLQIISVVVLQAILVIIFEVAAAHQSFLLICGALVAAVSGFLILNFPPAKIFMGDVGSGFLGLLGAILLLMLWHMDLTYFIAGLILWATFVLDATYTLMIRLFSGQNVFQAHRLHTYQKLADRWGNNRYVVMAYIAVNVGYLFPISIMVVRGDIHYYSGVVLAFLPLIYIARRVRAGIALEHQK